jgi:glycosyltransferase involved in cell wall biosynthesis
MKIGVDASRLTEEGRTGTQNYLYYLLQELSKLDKTNKYILYFRNDPGQAFMDEVSLGNENFSYKVLPKFISWTQVSLAYEVWKNTPDILFCSWHTIPGINPFWKMSVVSTIHDITGKFIPTSWTSFFSKRLIAVSNSTKDAIIRKFKIKDKKIDVIYEGYDIHDFSPQEKSKIEDAKKKYDIRKDYVFFLGTIGPRKNIERMVAAFNALDTDLEFVLGGNIMPGYENLSKLSAHFVGRVDQKDLAAVYSGAEFFTFMSTEEGFGIPILEAMACGIPVLTSNISSMTEIAGDAALLADPESVEDISQGMQRLIDDKGLSKKLVEAGFKQYKKFSWKSAAKETLEVFKEVNRAK